jgi:dipeptidase
MHYHNSYIVADRRRAWVLETVGREWVARAVRESASISNALTTRTEWDRSSSGLPPEAGERGLDIARTNSDLIFTRFSDAESRQCRTEDTIRSASGSFGVEQAMALLRDHGPHAADAGWSPAHGVLGATVCMHAGAGPVRVSQSTGSMVARVDDAGATVWLTGTSAPCTSVFKPVWLDAGLPDLGPPPGRRFDAATMWWRHELLHRSTLADYPAAMAAYRDSRDAVQADLLTEAADAADSDVEARAALSARAFRRVEQSEAGWLESVRALPQPPLAARLRTAAYRRAWAGRNRDEGVPL